MEPCDICYENRLPIKFFYLSCCRVNKLCFSCFEKLPSPTCPFCRETIPTIPKKKKKRSPPPLYEEISSLSSSRIERKQMRRLLKRQLHEDDQIRNRMRSFSI